MRTTIDLPDDLHKQAISIARDTSRSLNETVADLIRRGLGEDQGREVSRSNRTELPVIRLGRVVTTEAVRSLDDDLP